MSIAALALDRYADSTSSVAVKENNGLFGQCDNQP